MNVTIDEIKRKLLNTAEAAAYVGVQSQTLALWRSTGRYDLPFVKCGRSVKYRRADLDAWIEARVQTQTA